MLKRRLMISQRRNLKLEYIRRATRKSIPTYCRENGISFRGLLKVVNGKSFSKKIISQLEKDGLWERIQTIMILTNDAVRKSEPLTEARFKASVFSRLPKDFRTDKSKQDYIIHTVLGTLHVEVSHSLRKLTLRTIFFCEEKAPDSHIVAFFDF